MGRFLLKKASKDNLLVFRDQLKYKEIDDYYSNEGFVFTDSKGVIEIVFTYDVIKMLKNQLLEVPKSLILKCLIPRILKIQNKYKLT